MSEMFTHVANDENVDTYASKGMDVYVNIGKGNIGILGNHIFPNRKFAVRGTNEKLQKYLSRGVVSLLAAGYGTTESASVAEEQKPKKKKAAEPEVSAAEIPESVESVKSNDDTSAASANAPAVDASIDGVEEDSSNI